MLMQMTASADAIGHGASEASKMMGGRTLVTRVASIHANMLSKASGLRAYPIRLHWMCSPSVRQLVHGWDVDVEESCS